MSPRESTESEFGNRETEWLDIAWVGVARERHPNLPPLVAYRDEDDPKYLELLRKEALRILPVNRFGRMLLSVAELPGVHHSRSSEAVQSVRRKLTQDWYDARPFVLKGWASRLVESERAAIGELADVLSKLREPGTLRGFLSKRLGSKVALEPAELVEPERDLERYFVDDGSRGERLWVKSATLTSPTTNASGRVRFSFGTEGDDDASVDEAAHRKVNRLARKVLPIADALSLSRHRTDFIARFLGSPVLFTQHIAYWNAPGGGALLHHDAFREPAKTRQRGVCYVQLTGSTIWLALPTEDLVDHVRDFVKWLGYGEAPWVVKEYFGARKNLRRIAKAARDERWVEKQLASPGCGDFALLVNYSPEFLGQLIDEGHAYRLEAGDAILLPNLGLHRTCMHAVWCAGDEAGAGLSMAIRAKKPFNPPVPGRVRP